MAYRDSKNFFDREISWLAFNRRVLEEAQDKTTPLIDRLKFLGITASNMDEFFMVRVSGVQEQILSNIRITSQAGYTPGMQYSIVHQEARKQSDASYKCYNTEILPALAENKISILPIKKLSRKIRKELRERFQREVFPTLTPLAVDAGHPFPRVKGLSLNLIVELEGRSRSRRPTRDNLLIAVVQVPSNIPRLIEVQGTRETNRYILLEDYISEHIDALFPGMKVRNTACFRVTRDADIEYKEIEAEDLLKHIESEIRERERGMAVRLEIQNTATSLHVDFLSQVLKLTPQQVYPVDGPVAINEVSGSVMKMDGKDHLKESPYTPNIRKQLSGPGSIFSKIRKADILLHHPYESFVPVVDFIREAASDPKVLAIKQTLYRTSGDSPIIKSLIEAADNGKQVAALVELKARFDEENNIVWARQLEEAGVHVVYGLVGLKTHCKASMVVREEAGSIKRYVHLSTGNYNPSTARLYTDAGLFTCDDAFAQDATQLFNLLTGYTDCPEWKRLVVAPDDLRPYTVRKINEQRELAEKGKPAQIRAKLNSLVDTQIIVELYRASRAGVKIDLNIRGVCCLRPGVKGLSENIRVWSIVDRYLEHSRTFIFGAGDDADVYLSSADWMDRNMDRRVEVMFPVMDPLCKKRVIHEVYGASARGTVKARYLQPDGKYRKIRPRGKPVRSQYELMQYEAIADQEIPVAPAISEAQMTEDLITSVVNSPVLRKKPSRTKASSGKGKTASVVEVKAAPDEKTDIKNQDSES